MTQFCARKCILAVKKFKFNIFTYFSQKYEKIQWRIWDKLDNALNCHNSGYVQDKVVIFGSRVWFSGSANLTVSFIFYTSQLQGVLACREFASLCAMSPQLYTFCS